MKFYKKVRTFSYFTNYYLCFKNRVIFSNVNLFFSAVKDLKNENTSLKEKIMLLDNQIDILERAIGRGEYNKETIRVCY